MASGLPPPALSQASVLSFLEEQGGQVRNAELLSRFKPLLDPAGAPAAGDDGARGAGGGDGQQEQEEAAARRERFKGWVNAVAVVKELGGVKFVVLKKKYRRPLAAPEPRALQETPNHMEEEEGGEGEKDNLEKKEGEEEEEEEEAASILVAPANPGSPGPFQGPLPEEEKQALPVSQLKSLFQREDGEAPKPSSQDRWAPKGPPLKPCMLPVRCVVPSAGAPGQGLREPTPEEEQPGVRDLLQVAPSALRALSPYAKRRQLEETGSGSPYLRRVPKSQKVGEEAESATTVPLEAAEHEWLVKSTSGEWSPQLHGLLLSDKDLVSKRDFMSGFTVLHWAAKSGNCDMLHKVIEVAEKGGARVNVNVKSHGGYTPLHVAAIHGQEEVVAQLVRDYNAKVSLRDYSGKKPFQYLKEGSSFAVRHLLRDPHLHTVTGHNASIKKNPKVAASILSSTSTVLGLLSDDTAFYELTKGLKKPASFNKFLNAATAPRRKMKSRGTFSSYSSLSEALEEDQEETTTTTKRRPMSELFFGH
ncbi:ankyrin repeat domain-containing protein SOWAHA [Sceloporus undulatus]|uniref:ankyrin repeat domain-containing protein SOWAHA n=1 Tax=Sceloporus undulatus TaxID=8520 RepID=UPI001C4AEBC9|nr:ankyrin repeat domain-containing protein SOWAHA [Sceloporus undulatus]